MRGVVINDALFIPFFFAYFLEKIKLFSELLENECRWATETWWGGGRTDGYFGKRAQENFQPHSPRRKRAQTPPPTGQNRLKPGQTGSQHFLTLLSYAHAWPFAMCPEHSTFCNAQFCEIFQTSTSMQLTNHNQVTIAPKVVTYVWHKLCAPKWPNLVTRGNHLHSSWTFHWVHKT